MSKDDSSSWKSRTTPAAPSPVATGRSPGPWTGASEHQPWAPALPSHTRVSGRRGLCVLRHQDPLRGKALGSPGGRVRMEPRQAGATGGASSCQQAAGPHSHPPGETIRLPGWGLPAGAFPLPTSGGQARRAPPPPVRPSPAGIGWRGAGYTLFPGAFNGGRVTRVPQKRGCRAVSGKPLLFPRRPGRRQGRWPADPRPPLVPCARLSPHPTEPASPPPPPGA